MIKFPPKYHPITRQQHDARQDETGMRMPSSSADILPESARRARHGNLRQRALGGRDGTLLGGLRLKKSRYSSERTKELAALGEKEA